MGTQAKSSRRGQYHDFPPEIRQGFAVDIQRIIDTHYEGNATAFGRDCGSHPQIVWRWRKGMLPSYATIAEISVTLPRPVALDLALAWMRALTPPILAGQISIGVSSQIVADLTQPTVSVSPPPEIGDLISLLRSKRISPYPRKTDAIRAAAKQIGCGYSTISNWITGRDIPHKKFHPKIIAFVRQLKSKP